MGVCNSRQESKTPNPDQEANLDNQESKPPASSRLQIPPCLPLLCAPCTCTKGGCAAIRDPRETRATPINCCGSCEGSNISALCCGPCQVISGLNFVKRLPNTQSILQHLTYFSNCSIARRLLRPTRIYEWSDALFCSHPSTSVPTSCSKWRTCLNNVQNYVIVWMICT